MADGTTSPFETLLEYLRRIRGFNFGGYKRDSLRRRVDRRMQAVGIRDYTDYCDHLEVHPEEFAHLFNAILINVTDFFRDPPAWEALVTEVVPRILGAKSSTDPIRVWSAGCATGAEAYTIAMVLAEALGIERFRERVKIFATDVDEAALNQARQACYDAREVQGVAPPLLEKYFEPLGHRYVFHKELRRSVIFGRHDLMQDAPISRIDLLVCRNTLMYFHAEAQARILDRFHFALNDRGFLFLGKAETLLSYNHLFVAVDIKRRLFARVPKGSRRGWRPPALPRPGDGATEPLALASRVREAAFDQAPIAQFVVDAGGVLVSANAAARRLFGVAADEIGRPLHDLQLSYRPVDLRSCIDRAYADRRAIPLPAVEWPAAPDRRFYDITVVPLLDVGDTLLGVTIVFNDVTEARHAKEELERSTRELETAQEELQSANEELETTNEELQSANEELEAVNEELEAVNEELRQRSDELHEAGFFHEAVISSLNSGLIVLDPGLRVHAWNGRAEDLWGLRAEEVRGKDLLSLDIGLPVDALREPIQACLDGNSPRERITLDATNRRGRAIRCDVTCTPMRDGTGIRGVVVEMQDSNEPVTEPILPSTRTEAQPDGTT